MSRENIWGGIALGVVAGNAGGSKEKKGGKGLFPIGNTDIGLGLYGGGILGYEFNEKFGPYLTSGLIIGSGVIPVVGGGVSLNLGDRYRPKRFGVGVLIPLEAIIQAFQSPAAQEVGMRVNEMVSSYTGHIASTYLPLAANTMTAAANHITASLPILMENANQLTVQVYNTIGMMFGPEILHNAMLYGSQMAQGLEKLF